MDDNPQSAEFVAQLTTIQPSLRLYVYALMPGDAAAHDVVQQANVTLWRKRDEFVPGTNFGAWTFSVARFEVLNHRKRQARNSWLLFGEELEQVLAEDLLENTEGAQRRHEALLWCLKKLRQQDRELLLHRYCSTAGTLNDFAQRMGRSVGGLKVTLHRLRTALLGCIEKQLATPGAES